MEVVTKIVKKRKDKRASLPTLFEVLINSSFANEDKGLEMEWIDREIEYATQKLEEGRSTLQRQTIAQLMDIIGQLNLRKELLISKTSIIKEESSAWQLHKKSQSGFEIKAKG